MALSNKELEIILTLRDQVSRRLDQIEKKTGRSAQSMNANWLKVAAAVTVAVVAIKKISTVVIKMEKEVLSVNAKFETWTTTMRTFTKDTKEAKDVLEDLIEFSVKTPFTPGEVIKAGLLLKPLELAGFELDKLVLAAGNLKEAFGFNSLNESAENLSRALNSGVASAELFRQKGVTTYFQFAKGIDITNASLEEQRRLLIETFTTGQIGGAIERASLTFDGLSSTLEGLIFLFKRDIGITVFDQAKIDLEAIIKLIFDSREEGGKWNEIVQETGVLFKDLFDFSVKAAIGLTIGAAQAIDAWNEFEAVFVSLKLGFKEIELSVQEFLISTKLEIRDVLGELPEDPVALLSFMAPDLSVLNTIREEIQTLKEDLDEAAIDSNVDFSERVTAIFEKIKSEAEKIKTELMKKDKEREKAHDQVNKAMGKSDAEYLAEVQALWDKNTKTHMQGLLALGTSTASVMGQLATLTGSTWLAQAEIVITTIVQVMKVIAAAINAGSGFLGIAKAVLDVAAITIAAANAFKTIDSQKQALEAIGQRAAQPVVQVPALAQGGIVNRPTLALIGEAGPEAVIPLSGRGGGAGVSVQINIDSLTVREDEDIDRITEGISTVIAREVERI